MSSVRSYASSNALAEQPPPRTPTLMNNAEQQPPSARSTPANRTLELSPSARTTIITRSPHPVVPTMISLPLLAQPLAVPVDFLRWFPWCRLVYLLHSDQPLLLVFLLLSLFLILEKTKGMLLPAPVLICFYISFQEIIRHYGDAMCFFDHVDCHLIWVV